MSLRVVVDVNVYASAAANPRGSVWMVVHLGLRETYDLVVSDHILKTLSIVLTRPYFLDRVPEPERTELIDSLINVAHHVEPDPSVRGIADDEEDDIVLGTAVAAGADYLVTGDHGLLAVRSYGGVAIVTAREFLAIIGTEW